MTDLRALTLSEIHQALETLFERIDANNCQSFEASVEALALEQLEAEAVS